MNRSEQTEQQQQQPVIGVVDDAGPHQTALTIASDTPAVAVPSPTAFSSSPQQLAYQQAQQFHHHHQQLQTFWANQMQEIEQMSDFRNQSLPLTLIKKIMKVDEDVRMISAEAPVIFAKACEIIILELTLRSWIHTEENKRRALQKNNIVAAISRTEVFDFLVDIIPRPSRNHLKKLI
ncbi:Nuclear transcription factor Y subunit C-4 [Hibiscus syriacus]|uniref:Nuclear transcription factor Y subunit C-4 n=1 Tax=Hibiscus syriacus TaxID=106335 RepID=A0A6A2WLT0_HIBSY|nr:nuclear transcription factor Y subunit C-2-like [Hibiscus syriacus]KAE8660041.1 Nuclear transcription factor Y subunit C-4 [Hibiscus syriacus]